MEHVIWTQDPAPGPSVLIMAFDGWNDAGEAGTSAIDWLIERWQAEPMASIDPEDFFDFTAQRPTVRFDENGDRQIDWPTNEFHQGRIPGAERGVVLLRGTEPGLKWRTFCEQIIGVATATSSELLVSIGALLAEVPHTRPTEVTGTSPDRLMAERLGMAPSSYEGPTGIIGAVHDGARKAELPSLSLWATVPTYVSGARSPVAQLALVERLSRLLDTQLMTTDLEIASAAYNRQVDELVETDPDTREYVNEIETRHDEEPEPIATDPVDVEQMVSDLENFLRDEG